MFRQDSAAERVYLAEGGRPEAARALKTQAEATNPAEQVQDPEHYVGGHTALLR
jgi:hypothetical protein